MLTAKQERFAELVASGETKSAAYRETYDSNSDKPETVWHNACALAKDINVASRIEELTAIQRQSVDAAIAWNAERMASEALKNLTLSREYRQMGSANSSLELIGRLNGTLSDKQAQSGPGVTQIVIMGTGAQALPGPSPQEQPESYAIEAKVRQLDAPEADDNDASGERE
jgi:hypothetical protein